VAQQLVHHRCSDASSHQCCSSSGHFTTDWREERTELRRSAWQVLSRLFLGLLPALRFFSLFLRQTSLLLGLLLLGVLSLALVKHIAQALDVHHLERHRDGGEGICLSACAQPALYQFRLGIVTGVDVVDAVVVRPAQRLVDVSSEAPHGGRILLYPVNGIGTGALRSQSLRSLEGAFKTASRLADLVLQTTESAHQATTALLLLCLWSQSLLVHPLSRVTTHLLRRTDVSRRLDARNVSAVRIQQWHDLSSDCRRQRFFGYQLRVVRHFTR